MTADKCEAIFFSQCKTACTDFLLDTATIYDKGTLANILSILLEPPDRSACVNCRKDQIAAGDRDFIQFSVNNAGKLGKFQYAFIFLRGVYSMPILGICSGK